MWPASCHTRQQCAMEHIQPCPSQRTLPHHDPAVKLGLLARRLAPHHQHVHRPFFDFPPPPNYPPPYPSTSAAAMAEDALLAIPGPSSQRQPQEHLWEPHNDYSYAYYEPGPPTRHTNVPGGGTTYKEGSYRTRHTYLTRYGTEENIYEEISEVARWVVFTRFTSTINLYSYIRSFKCSYS